MAQQRVSVANDWQLFRAKLQEALAAHLAGSPAAFQRLWSHDADVSLMGALGGLQRGWAEVAARLDSVSRQLNAHELSVENVQTVVDTNIAVTADLERAVRTVDGKLVSRVLRCTQAYRIEGGEWRIFHRHAEEL
jgi:hypothetical protein